MHHRYTEKEKINPRLLENPVWGQVPGLWEVQDYLSAVPFSHFPQLSALAQNVMTALRDVSQLQKPSALRMLSQNKITQTCSFRKSFHFQIFSLLTNQGCYEGQQEIFFKKSNNSKEKDSDAAVILTQHNSQLKWARPMRIVERIIVPWEEGNREAKWLVQNKSSG